MRSTTDSSNSCVAFEINTSLNWEKMRGDNIYYIMAGAIYLLYALYKLGVCEKEVRS